MLRFRIPTLIAAVTLFLFSAALALAQPSPGRIVGTVRDANGAPVGGAAVTITNQETGAKQIVRSMETGAFSAADLPPGTYTVTVDPQGFLPVVQRNIRLDPGATRTLDVVLEVRVAEEVTVTAMKHEGTVHDTPFSIVAPDDEDSASEGHRELRAAGEPNGQRVRAEPGTRPEPGLDPRRLLGPDRARPAGPQGGSGNLPGRIADLLPPVHAQHRPLRHESRRGPARPAGYPLRLGFPVGDRAIHQQPARARRHPVLRRGHRIHDRRRQPGGRGQGRNQCSPSATRRPFASRRTSTTSRGTWTPCSRT